MCCLRNWEAAVKVQNLIFTVINVNLKIMKKRCIWARLNSEPQFFFHGFRWFKYLETRLIRSGCALQYRNIFVHWNFMLQCFYEHGPNQFHTQVWGCLPNVPPQALYVLVCMNLTQIYECDQETFLISLSFICFLTLTYPLDYASVLVEVEDKKLLFHSSHNNKHSS